MDNNYKFEQKYEISPFEKDINNLLKTGALLNCMQLTAANSLKRIGDNYSIEGLAKNNLGWFLIRYKIDFDNYPQNVDEILVKTECRGCQRMTTFRDFEVFDTKNNKRLLKAVTSWLVVNLETKSVINISQEFPDFLKFEKRENDLTLPKLKSMDEYDKEQEIYVMYDDLDMNGHVNNTLYVSWAMEALDYQFRTEHKLKSLDIFFKHEVKYGDKILSKVKFDTNQNITYHLLINKQTQEEVCILNAEFVKI